MGPGGRQPRSSSRRDGSFLDFVLDQLGDVEGVSARAMFGGHGLYVRGRFSGIVHDGKLYLRTDEASRWQYQGRGMRAFRPNDRQTLASYYEVPVEVLESREDLAAWMERAASAAT